MKRNATVTELLLVLAGSIGMIIAAWVNINSRVSILETQQENNSEQMREIKSELKQINKNTTDILIQLQNKADKYVGQN